MTFVAPRSYIVGSKESRRAVAVMDVTQIGGAGQNVVMGIIGIGTETVSSSQIPPCFWHDLHQAHGALARSSTQFSVTFDAHHRAYPALRNTEAMRRVSHEICERIDKRCACSARW